MFFHEEGFCMLDALNIAKVSTGVVILGLAGKYGFTDKTGRMTTAAVYSGIHLSYLTWWFLEQYLFPPFWDKRFTAQADPVGAAIVTFVFGIVYSLPAYNAFTKPKPLSPFVTITSIIMFCLGCLINTMADVQMHARKMAGAKGMLITNGIFRLAQNPNWFGDYLRYAAFGWSSGAHWSSFIPLMLGIITNYGATQDPAAKGGFRERYGAAVYDEWIANVPNKILPEVSTPILLVMVTVWMIWTCSYTAGYMTRTTSASTSTEPKLKSV